MPGNEKSNAIKVYYYIEETGETIEKEVECFDDDSDADPHTALTAIQDLVDEEGVPGFEARCGGSCACSTCHVIVDEEHVDKFDEPSSEEEDILEYICSGKTNRSRLGCQLKITKKANGVKLTIPKPTSL